MNQHHFCRRCRSAFFIVLATALLTITLLPEQKAVLLTKPAEWMVLGPEATKVAFGDLPAQYRQVRDSFLSPRQGYLYRTWTPEAGIVPLAVTSSAFVPPPYMSIAITGTSLSAEGRVDAYLRCEGNDRRLPIFNGSVNNNLIEALLAIPANWCPALARVVLIATDGKTFAGIGDAYAIDYLTYLKSSYLGRLPYLLTSWLIFSLVMFTGAALAERMGWREARLPTAFVALGTAALALFYLLSLFPVDFRWSGSFMILSLCLFILYASGADARKQTFAYLYPYIILWGLFALAYFTLLNLASNNLGHWEPNYRFWPAGWSSDNELPWFFAEAIRYGSALKDLFGGGWRPSDRPPLMAGAHLLTSDAFALLQSNNDGHYLRGHAYNAAALALSTLWVPAAYWLMSIFNHRLTHRDRLTILLILACIPLFIINSIYGWPKAFGAAFALMAFGVTLLANRENPSPASSRALLLFFPLAAFSVLAHPSSAPFVVPLTLLVTVQQFKHQKKYLLFGLVMAAMLGLSWAAYKSSVLESHEPLLKYALTGDFGFQNPDLSPWAMLIETYGKLNLAQWLDVKTAMLLQVLLPIHHPIAQIALNSVPDQSPAAVLRAWDFMLLSRGNVVLIIFLFAAIGYQIKARRQGVTDGALAPFLYLIWLAITSWLLYTLFFIAPAVLHHLPLAALMGLAIGGFVIVYDCYPKLFAWSAFAMLTYAGLVWFFHPLQSSLSVDPWALTVITGFLSWIIISNNTAMVQGVQSAGIGGSACAGLSHLINKVKQIGAIFPENGLTKASNYHGWTYLIYSLPMFAFIFLSYNVFQYIHQPLADAHAFRQTQTASTAYWMLAEGWDLAYQTPVVGYPWSIPFEFPLYQAIVAAITALSGFELEPVGRFVSYIFLVACAWPAFMLRQRLDLPEYFPWVFCALLWTTPLYVYWGRTFMIETTAVYFVMACLPYAVDIIRKAGGWLSMFYYVALASAAVLQKGTTGAPVILFLLATLLIGNFSVRGINWIILRSFFLRLVVLSVPLLIGMVWNHYADLVKSANIIGATFTTSALSSWNFGMMSQRFDLDVWYTLLLERSTVLNFIGFLVLLVSIFRISAGGLGGHYARICLLAIALYLSHLFFFIKLHHVHDYYQVSTLIYLIAAIAMAIAGGLFLASRKTILIPALTIIVVTFNILSYNNAYGRVAARFIEEMDTRSVQSYKVGKYLRQLTPEGSALAIFGQSWSSEISFHSRRKAITVFSTFPKIKRVWENPGDYVGGLKIMALVICPPNDEFPTISDLKDRLRQEREWVHVSVYGCEILLRSVAEK